MSELVVNRESCKENLHRINEFSVGEVVVDTECGDTLLIVSSDSILTDAVDAHMEKVDPDGEFAPFDGFDDCILAVSLESGELMKYRAPYRKVIKEVKSARLYVKE